MESPLLTVEPVITEAMFLLRRHPHAQDKLLQMVCRGDLSIPFGLEAEAETVRLLREKYRDLPMSLADACLVRMAELHPSSVVCTIDSDFKIYRKYGRSPIPLITPD